MKNKVPAVTVCPQGSRLLLSCCMHAEAAAQTRHQIIKKYKVLLIKNGKIAHAAAPLSGPGFWCCDPSSFPPPFGTSHSPWNFPPRELSVFTLPALTFTFPPASHLLSDSPHRLCVSYCHFPTFAFFPLLPSSSSSSFSQHL